ESHFAVQKIQTKLAWEDLELLPRTINQLKDIENWLSHGDTLLNDWGLAGRLSTAFLALFHGVPGTGKRMVAGLLGKSIDIPVYKVNSPMLVSTYIGETEKNLAHLFDLLDQKKCILFFDEADALFGKRTNIQSAESRYINQAMAYLLHKLENVSGVAILAFENKMNLDQNFIRRFQASIDFPMPDPTQRLRIWQREIPKQAALAADINLTAIAQKFELSRGSIINIIRNVSIKALSKGSNEITATDLKQGIHQELSRIGSIQ
ncbi:MAG: ATP-binding protein, partial [Saprospiraceae bacterium]|nr:ATP-binding protein [Saprospiraceae bacterium]